MREPVADELGRPGIRFLPPEPVREITGVARDVAAFAGIAPRGPVRLPDALTLEADVDVATWLATAPTARSVAVAIDSWDEYRYRFGAYEGPGRLPYAVAAYFAAGGRRAYVIRVVHRYGAALLDAAGRASGAFASVTTTDGEAISMSARSEGTWGRGLAARLTFATRPLPCMSASTTGLVVGRREWVPGGTLLRLTLPGGVRTLRYVERSSERDDPAGPGRRRDVELDVATPAAPIAVEVVTAAVEVVDRDPTFARSERIVDVGLRADHPRWLARVLVHESELVWPDAAWAGGTVALVDAALPAISLVGADGGPAMTGGTDRWADVVPEDFWDPMWVPGDDAGEGVHCLVGNDEVGLLVAPDLYDPSPLPAADDVTDPLTLCGPDFEVHVDLGDPPAPTPRPPGLVGLALDPTIPADLARIVHNQSALVAHAEQRRDLTVLLDVPLGLSPREVLAWRAAFDSAHAAAYHPWLDVAAPDDQRDALVRINPSAFAAGIVAEREIRLGVQFGPANQIAAGAVRVASEVSTAEHDALHVDGVNVFVPERDGIRLTGARTLSRRLVLRQLSVARLMTVLRLSLEREMQWAAFEPNGEALWAEIRRVTHGFLTRLFEARAFRGATTKEAFFVTCDRTTMTTNDLDNGRMICLVGVAPAEPVEYLLLELALEAEKGIQVTVAA